MMRPRSVRASLVPSACGIWSVMRLPGSSAKRESSRQPRLERSTSAARRGSSPVRKEISKPTGTRGSRRRSSPV